jgi:integrase
MATVRKRTWQTKAGKRTAWIADYFDQDGIRRIKTFATRRAANAWLPKAQREVQTGAHVPDSTAQTMREAIEAWISRGEADRLEISTMRQRRLHRGHILDVIEGGTRLSRVSVTRLEAARDELLRRHSHAMTRKVISSLKAVLRQAKAVHLATADLRVKSGARDRRKLKVGVDLPSAQEVRSIIGAATGHHKALAFICLAAFSGLRASELRGLRWSHLDLAGSKVTIEERADEICAVGSPKSEAAKRTIGLNATTVRALKEWKLAQPGGRTLIFGTRTDRPDRLANLVRRLLDPLLAKAKVRHYGPHAFRHFAVSSWLKTCNGDFKAVQVRAGHSTLAMTLDRYGHLLDTNDGDQIAAAERLVLG